LAIEDLLDHQVGLVKKGKLVSLVLLDQVALKDQEVRKDLLVLPGSRENQETKDQLAQKVLKV